MKKKTKKRIRKPLEGCPQCGKKRVLNYYIFAAARSNPHLKGRFKVCQTCYRKAPAGRRL